MKKVGILGGTFNPIHKGHLSLAKAAKEQYALDEIWFMPSKLPPHKSHVGILSEQQRLKMVSLAVEEENDFFASDFEFRREGITYTVETLSLLRTEYPECEFYFIIGGDSFVQFLTWREPLKILSMTALLYTGRKGITKEEEAEAQNAILAVKPDARINKINMQEYPISSKEIRAFFFRGQSGLAENSLPPKVYQYLLEHHLFENVSYAELDQEMRRILPEKRYYHSVGVAQFSAAFAASMNLDPKKAMIAGILHDCAKPLPDEELVFECEKRGILFSKVERRNGFLLHGKLAASLIQEKYNIFDPDIISAVYHHCEGRPEMTGYEKAVFMADYVEPFRDFSPIGHTLNEIRKLAFQNMDDALYLVLQCQIRFLEDIHAEIEQTTVRTLSYYKEVYQKNHRREEDE